MKDPSDLEIRPCKCSSILLPCERRKVRSDWTGDVGKVSCRCFRFRAMKFKGSMEGRGVDMKVPEQPCWPHVNSSSSHQSSSHQF
jgi:hypothetical protein